MLLAPVSRPRATTAAASRGRSLVWRMSMRWRRMYRARPTKSYTAGASDVTCFQRLSGESKVRSRPKRTGRMATWRSGGTPRRSASARPAHPWRTPRAPRGSTARGGRGSGPGSTCRHRAADEWPCGWRAGGPAGSPAARPPRCDRPDVGYAPMSAMVRARSCQAPEASGSLVGRFCPRSHEALPVRHTSRSPGGPGPASASLPGCGHTGGTGEMKSRITVLLGASSCWQRARAPKASWR